MYAIVIMIIAYVIYKKKNKNYPLSIYRPYTSSYTYFDKYLSLIDAQGYLRAGVLCYGRRGFLLKKIGDVYTLPHWDRDDEIKGPLTLVRRYFNGGNVKGVFWLASESLALYLIHLEMVGCFTLEEIDMLFLERRTKSILRSLDRNINLENIERFINEDLSSSHDSQK